MRAFRNLVLAGVGLSLLAPVWGSAQESPQPTWDPWVRVAVWAGYSRHCGDECGVPGRWILRVELTPKALLPRPTVSNAASGTNANGVDRRSGDLLRLSASPQNAALTAIHPGTHTFGGGLTGLGTTYQRPWIRPPVREQSPGEAGGAVARSGRLEELRLIAGEGFEISPFEYSRRLFCSSDRGTPENWLNERLKLQTRFVVSAGLTWQGPVLPAVVDGVEYAAVEDGLGLVVTPGVALDWHPLSGPSQWDNTGLHALWRFPMHLVWSDVLLPDGTRDRRGVDGLAGWNVQEILFGFSFPLGERWHRPLPVAGSLSERIFATPTSFEVAGLVTTFLASAQEMVLAPQLDALTLEINRLREQIDRSDAQLERLQEQLTRLEEQLARLRAQVDRLQDRESPVPDSAPVETSAPDAPTSTAGPALSPLQAQLNPLLQTGGALVESLGNTAMDPDSARRIVYHNLQRLDEMEAAADAFAHQLTSAHRDALFYPIFQQRRDFFSQIEQWLLRRQPMCG